jgi:hypothetical protein
MFPQDKLGAGAFTVLFQNTQEGERKETDVEVLSAIWMNTNREDIKE